MRAVDGLSFSLGQGEVLGIVGESGSGKTVSMLSVMRLIRDPNAVVEGQVLHRGRDLMTLSQREMQSVRGAEIAMIFQDPMTALTPVYRVGWQIAEQLRAHEPMSARARTGADGRAAPRGRDPQREPPRRRLPASVLGRDAAARDDRDGPLVQSVAPDRRRADDRARRDDPGADPGADEAPSARPRLLDRPHHPRHGRRRRPRRAGRRDVRRQRRRGGLEVGCLPGPAASVHLGAAGLDAAHRPAPAAPSRRDPGHAAVAARASRRVAGSRLAARTASSSARRGRRSRSGSRRAERMRAISTRRFGRRCRQASLAVLTDRESA